MVKIECFLENLGINSLYLKQTAQVPNLVLLFTSHYNTGQIIYVICVSVPSFLKVYIITYLCHMIFFSSNQMFGILPADKY